MARSPGGDCCLRTLLPVVGNMAIPHNSFVDDAVRWDIASGNHSPPKRCRPRLNRCSRWNRAQHVTWPRRLSYDRTSPPEILSTRYAVDMPSSDKAHRERIERLRREGFPWVSKWDHIAEEELDRISAEHGQKLKDAMRADEERKARNIARARALKAKEAKQGKQGLDDGKFDDASSDRQHGCLGAKRA
jgi:hypothetical protein